MSNPLPDGAVPIPKEAKKVHDGVLFDVYQWQQKLYDGSTATFERIKRVHLVLAVVIEDGKICVQQHEQPGKPLHWGIPGGRVEPDEDLQQAAARELKEETGLVCKNWSLKHVGMFTQKIDGYIYTYVATDITERGKPAYDPGEKFYDLEWWDADRILSQLKENMQPREDFLIEEIGIRGRTVDELRELPDIS